VGQAAAYLLQALLRRFGARIAVILAASASMLGVVEPFRFIEGVGESGDPAPLPLQ
jgi:hypothetical protein